MVEYSDLSESIQTINSAISAARRDVEKWKNDEKMLELFSLCHEVYWSQIHEYYTGLNNDRGEKGIRKCVKEIVAHILPLLEEKVSKNKDNLELSMLYADCYDDFYALASCRSLSHFVRYMEFDKKPKEKIWEPTMHLFGGFWYYANSMILNGDVKFISKQCFTGLGKTYSNAMTLAFIFGNNINDDALYVFGASENVGTFTLGLIDLMVSPRYAKVFPYFKQFLETKVVDGKEVVDTEATSNNMFSIKQAKDSGSKLRIRGSSKPVNLRVVSKEKNTNGVRAKYLFLDDIAQLADANNPKAHEKDKFRLSNEWFKRNYDLTNFYVIAGGTTYSVDDILTHLLRLNNGDIAQVSKINRFTKIAKSDYIIKDGVSVFVIIPKLDYETDESTYPEKYPTAEARLQRDNALDNGRMFQAMEQQQPLSSVDNPFDWGNLHIYEDLPDENGKYRFILDPSRKGNDKTCCLYFREVGDRHYLVDAFLDNKPLDYVYPSGKTVLETICEKIKNHRCIEGSAEENTESTIKSQIIKTLEKMRYTCKVETYYSWQQKKDKIYAAQTAVQSYLWFPSRRVFPANSEVGRAMSDITYWKYKDNIADDAPECCAVYCTKYIKFQQMGFAQVHSFKR